MILLPASEVMKEAIRIAAVAGRRWSRCPALSALVACVALAALTALVALATALLTWPPVMLPVIEAASPEMSPATWLPAAGPVTALPAMVALDSAPFT